MKKKIGEINGLLLSNKQMKDLKGGTRVPMACGTNCSVNTNYACAENALKMCVCGGATSDGGFKVDKCTA